MSDRILITGCRIPVHVGITDEERSRKQEIVVDAEISWDIRQSAASDDLNATVNYAAVCERLWAIAEEKPRLLIETFAEELASAVLHEFSVDKVRIRVSKPAAIRHIGGALAAVEIERRRAN